MQCKRSWRATPSRVAQEPGQLELQVEETAKEASRIQLPMPATIFRRGHELRLAIESGQDAPPNRRDGRLVELIVRAHDARRRLLDLQGASGQICSQAYEARLARLSYLAPDIFVQSWMGNSQLASRRASFFAHLRCRCAGGSSDGCLGLAKR